MMIQLTTIKDIAVKANVSPATVSRVLNYDLNLSVTDQTRKRIFEAAEALSYHKHTTKKTTGGKIAIVHWCTESEQQNDLYYLDIHLGAEQRCQALQLTPDVDFPDAIGDIQADPLKGINAIGKSASKQVKRLPSLSPSIVFVHESPSEDIYHSVIINLEQAVRKIITHFIGQTH